MHTKRKRKNNRELNLSPPVNYMRWTIEEHFEREKAISMGEITPFECRWSISVSN